MTATAYDLTSTAMLASMKISSWAARVTDKDITQDVSTTHAARDNTGKFTKRIIDKAGMKAITDVISQARQYHLSATLPWGQDGIRILPAKKFSEYSARMRGFEADFDMAVNAFEANYIKLKDEARDMLGTMYDENNYPHVSEIKEKFKIEVSIMPIPKADDFRVNLSTDIVDQIKKDIEKKEKDILANAVKSVWKRLFDTIKIMQDRLSNPETKLIRAALIENIRDIVNIIPELNITNDKDLEAMRKEVEKKLCVYTRDELQAEPEKRYELAETAEEIMKRMEGYL